MPKKRKILKAPEVPQKRTPPVVKLVERPASFRGACDYLEPMPEKDRPKGSPRNVEFLGSVEWSWTPWNDRSDEYYLNPRGRYWLLWLRDRDEDNCNRWEWILYAYGPKRGVDAEAAAIYLLLGAWNAEKEHGSLHTPRRSTIRIFCPLVKSNKYRRTSGPMI